MDPTMREPKGYVRPDCSEPELAERCRYLNSGRCCYSPFPPCIHREPKPPKPDEPTD